jgi:hypothetical protein
MLGEQGDTYLMEVNFSPGLHRPDVDLHHQLLSRKLVHDLISLKGLAPEGRHNQFTTPTLVPLKYHMVRRYNCLRCLRLWACGCLSASQGTQTLL